ncbi:O-antigen ligase family protein [Stieleria sp. JC731]|uniref:O-antigen ligase family protein n=1 Tax=Pirellulaceae TaxID=2691357 RepID=UPI001E454B11|nr:O-antigen ligase family protein [Stieleria sp. JC731]MCC9601465.1 O-antigen ligase family protein [Stieleria sp. JC731]
MGYTPPLVGKVVGVCLLLSSAIGIRYPIAAAVAVTSTAFGIARYSAELEWAWGNAFQACVIFDSAIALILSPQARVSWLRLRREQFKTGILLAGLLTWAIVSESLAIVYETGDPGPKHSLLRLVESVILCTVIMVSVTDFRRFVIVVGASVVALGGSYLQLRRLEHASDFAFAAAPLSCLLAGSASALNASYFVSGVALSSLLAAASFFTANRGANVGWLMTMICMAIAQLRSLRIWTAIIGLVVLASFVAYRSPLRPRIQEWIDNGWSTTTLASRVEFWKSSLSRLPDHSLTGIGPGRGGQDMSRDLQLKKWRATHNSFLEILSEQGIVGGLLWCGLLFNAFAICLSKVGGETACERAMAIGIGACLLAMVIAGMAISRHDDVRLFWAIGCAFALKTAHFDRPNGCGAAN